jgi:LacI family transcriptional regulator
MITIYDIAEKAGVSGSTVSRALNGSRLVSDAVRDRVQAIANDLGFEKRHVRRHRQRTILSIRLVLPRHEDPERGLFYDLTQLIGGLRKGFMPTAVNLLCDLEGPDFRPFPHKKGGDTDAFVFAFHRPQQSVIEGLRERGIPFVLLNRSIPGLPCIASDHVRGMRDLVAHLRGSGRELRPCLVAIEKMGEIFNERRQGLSEALGAAGIAFSPEADVHCFPGTSALTGEPVHELARRYNTIFCINDIVGMAVLAELAHAGVRVPEDCQVTGFDDSPLRRLTRPLLTTVAMPVYELARHAGKRLAAEVIEGSSQGQLERLRGALIPGGSTFTSPPADPRS